MDLAFPYVNQLIDFYKVLGKGEKCSFTKIINVSRGLGWKLSNKSIEAKSVKLLGDYNKTDFQKVRDKYLAHQDLTTGIVKTDLLTIASFTKRILRLSNLFLKEFKRDPLKFTNHIRGSFKKIFKTIDEFERVKAFLIASQIKGKKEVRISAIANIINDKQRLTRRSTGRGKQRRAAFYVVRQ